MPTRREQGIGTDGFVGGLLGGLALLAMSQAFHRQHDGQVYASGNLLGLPVSAECNPGGDTCAPADGSDVAMIHYDDRAQVVSNINRRRCWVNAFATSKFVEALPDGRPLDLMQGWSRFESRLPVKPRPSLAQQENPEQMGFTIMLYDGRDIFGRGAKRCLEASGFWKLNPWSPDYGQFFFYTAGLEVVPIDFYVRPDLAWHQFELTCDFRREVVTSLSVDGERKNLDLPVYAHAVPEWGTDVGAWATLESESAYPQADCRAVFWWGQEYRNLSWGLV